MNKYFTKKLWNYFTLDIVFAYIFIFIAITFIFWSIITKHYGIHLPVLLLSSSLIYLFNREKLSQNRDLLLFNENNKITQISNIVFTMSISIMIWLSWSNLYYRPPLYFLLILVASTSIVLYIFHLNELNISHIFIALFKIIVLSLTVYTGIYYQFPGIYGCDPWWHNEQISNIINAGSLSYNDLKSYYLFPLFHIAGTMTKIITILNVYDSVFISVGVLMATSSLFFYLISKKFISTKASLLVALIIPLSADNIERATAIIPMSLGYIFFLMIFYLLFRGPRKISQDSLLKIIVSIAVILTHTIASIINLINLIIVFLSNKLQKRMGNRQITQYESVSMSILLFFAVLMLTRWMQNTSGTDSFFDWNLRNLFKSYQIDAQFVLSAQVVSGVASDIPYEILLLNQGGLFILLTFAIIGSLIYLHPRNYTQDKITLVMVAGVLFVMPFVFSLFELKNILPDRWNIFLYIPLSILAVNGIISTSSLVKNRFLIKQAIVIIILLGIIFTMTTNSMANDDSPFVFNEAVRAGYTQSEITAIDTIYKMDPGIPIADSYYKGIFSYIVGSDKDENKKRINSTVYIKRNYYLYHPEWNENYRDGISIYKIYGIDKGFMIYDNGNVKTYSIPG